MVRFKIGFEIGAETLFGMLSKMLPIDNLSVEEITPIKTERVITGIKSHPQIAKRTPPRKKRNGRHDLSKGMNRIVVDAWADHQPHKAIELRPLFKAAGFSENSVNSLLERLREHGVVFQPELGLWQLAGE